MTQTDRFQLQLERQYYFAEAMAFYEAYYAPVRERVTESAPEPLRDAVASGARADDRPLTWVPIVWHATTFHAFESIVKDGVINAPVHLTELPIGELDRIRLRKHTKEQVAIGFPRRFLETQEVTPVLYTKHNPALARVINEHPEVHKALAPFLAEDDDTSSFLELRTTRTLPVERAVWLLTSADEAPDGTKRPWLPALDSFQEKWGRVPISYWHRSHQMGVLDEWHYLELRRDPEGALLEALTIGEHYWKRHCFTEERQRVLMPTGRSWELKFQVRDEGRAKAYEGPYGFLDLAKRFKGLLEEVSGARFVLPSALMPNLSAVHSGRTG